MASRGLTGDWASQIAAMRGLTSAVGALHEGQVLQLKQWGAIAFYHVGAGKWECVVDINSRVVTYDIARAKHPRNFAHLIASLDRSIHWLLGDEWALHVIEQGKPLYVGTAQVTRSEKVNEQRQARVKGRSSGSGRRTP